MTTLEAPAPLGDLIDLWPGGACHVGVDDRVTAVNGRFLDALALPAWAAEAGVPLDDLVAEVPDAEAAEAVRVALSLSEGEGGGVSVRCRAADGGLLLTCEAVTAGGADGPPAGRDPLTGLVDREEFARQTAAHAARAAETFEEVALLYFDLDRFKPVNDTLGHPVGDRVLQEVARRVGAEVREGDVVARLGGDEFAVLQVGAPQPGGSRSLARRIIDAVALPFRVEGHTVSVGVSVGIAVAPFDAECPVDLMRNADLAMYRAKNDGRNVARYFEPSMTERLAARRQLERDLRVAVEAEQFEVLYQPVKDLATQDVSCVEALVRWRRPAGVVSPAEFIPLAEETGLVVPIGRWVLRRACRDAAAWDSDAAVAVNVSAVQLRDRRFVDVVAEALAESGLPARRLELEITETALMADTELTVAILTELRAAGVRVAMDDFGTGYSSISYLRRFPFDKIKIDRSFVAGSDRDVEAEALVRMIASLGLSLSVATTAEGVETDREMDLVRDAGCSQIQGYLLSRPIPDAEIRAFLADRAGVATPPR